MRWPRSAAPPARLRGSPSRCCVCSPSSDQDRAAAAQLAERLRAMRADNEACAAATAAVLARAAPDLVGADPLAALRLLRERLAEQRGHRQRRVVLQEQIAQADLTLDDLARQLDRRQADLRAVLLAIGAATIEAAEARLALSRDRAEQAGGSPQPRTSCARTATA